LPRAINVAVAARLQRPAEYIRAAIFARLQADGVAIGTPEAETDAVTSAGGDYTVHVVVGIEEVVHLVRTEEAEVAKLQCSTERPDEQP
jgi:hypothetical protein